MLSRSVQVCVWRVLALLPLRPSTNFLCARGNAVLSVCCVCAPRKCFDAKVFQ